MIAYMHAAEPLTHFVDDFLAYLYEARPTNATLDGVHLHDDLLEDFGRSAIETHLGALAGFARRLDAIPVDLLPLHEQVDHGIVGSNIRARMFELGGRPDLGAEPPALRRGARIEPGGAGDVHLRARDRAGAPRPLEAAPDPATHSGGARQRQGAARHLRQGRPRDLARHSRPSSTTICRARFPASTTCTCWAISPTRRPRRFRRSAPTSTISRTTSRPRARAPSAWAGTGSNRSCDWKKASVSPSDRLLAIAMRELPATQEEFRTVAGRAERWRSHRGVAEGPRGAIRRRARSSPPRAEQLDELRTFLERQAVVDLPAGEPVSMSRRRRSSTAGRSPACGRRARSRRSRLARDLLPDRRRSLVAGRTAAGAPARLQPADALVDLDPRGLPGALPALPAPASGRLQGAQVDALRAGVVRRRLGALLRADDGRGGLRARRSRPQARPARRSAHPARALHRRHPAPRGGLVGGAGRAVLPRRGVPGRDRARGARPSAARSTRPTWCTRPAS